MPVEEHKELRDLVSQTLQAKGVLQKVQAEIRASVFLALEEQDLFKDKNPFINQPLKDFLTSQEGLIAVSLVREFLEFFNLEFTSMVFDPETHAGNDYTYEGRSKLSKELKLDSNDGNAPLLGTLIRSVISSVGSAVEKSPEHIKAKVAPLKNDLLKVSSDGPLESMEKLYTNGLNDSSADRKKPSVPEPVSPERLSRNEKSENKNDVNKRLSMKKDLVGSGGGSGGSGGAAKSLSSLGNLPPLTRTPLSNSTAATGVRSAAQGSGALAGLKALLDLDTVSDPAEDLILKPSEKEVKESKTGDASPPSEESEVEDEVSEVGSGLTDDNTIDITISKESGKADYFEDLQ